MWSQRQRSERLSHKLRNVATTRSHLEPLEVAQPCQYLDFSPVKQFWTSGIQNYNRINICCFKPPGFLAICFRSHREPIHRAYQWPLSCPIMFLSLQALTFRGEIEYLWVFNTHKMGLKHFCLILALNHLPLCILDCTFRYSQFLTSLFFFLLISPHLYNCIFPFNFDLNFFMIILGCSSWPSFSIHSLSVSSLQPLSRTRLLLGNLDCSHLNWFFCCCLKPKHEARYGGWCL